MTRMNKYMVKFFNGQPTESFPSKTKAMAHVRRYIVGRVYSTDEYPTSVDYGQPAYARLLYRTRGEMRRDSDGTSAYALVIEKCTKDRFHRAPRPRRTTAVVREARARAEKEGAS